MSRLALHTCCAPCLIGVHEALTQEMPQLKHITAVFYNPNIAPKEEYFKRRDACRDYAHEQSIGFIELEPDFDTWIKGQADEGASKKLLEQRCQFCYDLRLGRVAQWAHDSDCDFVVTTLSISPWQNLEAINRAGDKAVSNFSDLHFAHRDFRIYYRNAQKRVRALGIYCQNYCGCLPSKVEAEASRAARRKRK